MEQQQSPDTSAALAAAPKGREQKELILRLYIAGATQRSTAAITTLLQLCEEHFAGRYKLEILDIYQYAERALADSILATPTLLLLAPIPGRYFIGDLQQLHRLLASLGISSTGQNEHEEHSNDPP